jgi:hypothetical protein
MAHRLFVSAALACSAFFALGCEKEHIAVTTYHYDNLRTGWDGNEERLKPKTTPSMPSTQNPAPKTAQPVPNNHQSPPKPPNCLLTHVI